MWRQWGVWAACAALVLCLTAVALPYLQSMKTAAEAGMDGYGMTEADYEKADAVVEECEPAERLQLDETPAESEPPDAEDAMPEEDWVGMTAEDSTLLFDGQLYAVTDHAETPVEELKGEYLGVVEDASNEDWIGCAVYACREETPDDILVELPDGYLYCTQQTE